MYQKKILTPSHTHDTVLYQGDGMTDFIVATGIVLMFDFLIMLVVVALLTDYGFPE
jgi:hypothetical protein